MIQTCQNSRKALIVTTVGGFVPRFEMDNVHLMQKMGYEVHYASNFNNTIYEFDENELINEGIVLHQIDIDKNPYNFIKLAECYKKLVQIILNEKIRLIHCHTPVGGVLGRLAGRKTGCRVIYTAHGFHFYKGAPVIAWMLYYPVEKYLSKYTDCLITINREDFELSKRLKAKDCVQIPGIGIEIDKFAPGKNYKKDDGIFRIVSVGELSRNKNHRTIIKAIAKLDDKNIQYNIYGKGRQKNELQKLINKKNLSRQVHLCGYTSKIKDVLQQADCFVFPSIREGLGMAALEAMACGVPLIAADNRGTREYAIHGNNSLVCKANDVDGFAYCIRLIKDDPKLAKKMSLHETKMVKRFTKYQTNQIMEQVYRKISL